MYKIFVIGAAGVVLGIAGLAYSGFSIEEQRSVGPLSERQSYWQDRIRNLGAAAAYDALAETIVEESVGAQHSEAHAFGVALFEEEGLAGISVCDSRFSFGCFHEFLGRAIATNGVKSIPALNDSCFENLTESPLSCQHGIGHGVVSVFGYGRDGLKKSLAECRALDRGDPIGGCYGGVFMEYNVRTMLGVDATPREYTGNPFAPCDSLDSAYTPACIYWQPQWWTQAVLVGKPASDQFASMGDYCREFSKTPVTMRACFEGIGNIVTQAANFDPKVARKLCESVGGRAEEQLLCIATGANHFGIDVDVKAAALMCEDLGEEHYAYCMAYARNEANIANVRAISL